jgi:hypothetical protein
MTIENSQKIRLNILSEVVSRIGELEKKALQNPKATLEELEHIQHEKFTDDAEQRPCLCGCTRDASAMPEYS